MADMTSRENALYVPPWFAVIGAFWCAVIGAFRSSLLFRLVDVVP